MIKNIIIIIIGISLLIVSFSTSYYFLVKLPDYNNAKIEFEKQKYEDEQDRIKEKELQDTIKEENLKTEIEEKQVNLDNCLKNSSITYKKNWDNDCKIDKSNYPTSYKEDENGNCLLSKDRVNRIEDVYREQKDECYKRFGD